MIYVRDLPDQALLNWAARIFQDQCNIDALFTLDGGKCQVKAVDRDGEELLAAVLFHDYIPGVRMEMSIASVSPKWCNRRVLFECFNYCFNICDIKRIYTQVHGNNEVAKAMNKRLGFNLLAVLPEFQKTRDGEIVETTVFTMTKDQCRWI